VHHPQEHRKKKATSHFPTELKDFPYPITILIKKKAIFVAKREDKLRFNKNPYTSNEHKIPYPKTMLVLSAQAAFLFANYELTCIPNKQ
jgi:hypothetical protein